MGEHFVLVVVNRVQDDAVEVEVEVEEGVVGWQLEKTTVRDFFFLWW